MHAAAPVLAAALTQLTALTVTLFWWGAEGANWRATMEHLAQLALQRHRMELEYARVGLSLRAVVPTRPTYLSTNMASNCDRPPDSPLVWV